MIKKWLKNAFFWRGNMGKSQKNDEKSLKMINWGLEGGHGGLNTLKMVKNGQKWWKNE